MKARQAIEKEATNLKETIDNWGGSNMGSMRGHRKRSTFIDPTIFDADHEDECVYLTPLIAI